MPASVGTGCEQQRSESVQLSPVLLLRMQDAPPRMGSAFQSYLYLLTNNLDTSTFCCFFTAARQLLFLKELNSTALTKIPVAAAEPIQLTGTCMWQSSARGRPSVSKYFLTSQKSGTECEDRQSFAPYIQQFSLVFRQPSGAGLWKILGNQSPPAKGRLCTLQIHNLLLVGLDFFPDSLMDQRKI